MLYSAEIFTYDPFVLLLLPTCLCTYSAMQTHSVRVQNNSHIKRVITCVDEKHGPHQSSDFFIQRFTQRTDDHNFTFIVFSGIVQNKRLNHQWIINTVHIVGWKKERKSTKPFCCLIYLFVWRFSKKHLLLIRCCVGGQVKPRETDFYLFIHTNIYNIFINLYLCSKWLL